MRKIFFQPSFVGIAPDYLFYSFGLSIGDTLLKYCCGSNNDTLYSVVTQIDTIQTLVDTRRRFKIQSSNAIEPIWGFQDDNNYIIEGIGSKLGFSGYRSAPFNTPQEAPFVQLLCYWENGTYILEPSFGCFELAIGEVENEKFIFSTYPNPATDFNKLISPAFLSKKLLITINNNSGQYVFYHKAYSKLENSININNFISGIYYINVLDEAGRIIYTSEITKQ